MRTTVGEHTTRELPRNIWLARRLVTVLALAAAVITAPAAARAQGGPAPAAEAAGGPTFRIRLLDGAVITARIGLRQLSVRSDRGPVSVPIAKVVSLTPGLDARPKLAGRVAELIEALGSENWRDRANAQAQLIRIGPVVGRILQAHADDKDLERRTRVGVILKLYETWTLMHPGRKQPPIQPQSTVTTDSGVVTGRIGPEHLPLVTRFGKLTARLDDINRVVKVRPAATKAAPRKGGQIALVLRDGSRRTGQATSARFALRTRYGPAAVPLGRVVMIDLAGGREDAEFRLNNGDKLRGALALKRIVLAAAGEEVSAPIGEVVSVQCGTLSRLIALYLVHGRVDGHATDFVKGLPKALAARAEKVTKTANTIGSVVSRAKTSPWLYPVRGKGEIPRILREGGKMYYPIWGTWRSRLGSGWHHYEQNRKPIPPARRETMPHIESSVDYYVVPTETPKAG